MLCYAMLCYAMLCYAMLCYAMLCYAMLCYAMLCYAILYYTINGYKINKIHSWLHIYGITHNYIHTKTQNTHFYEQQDIKQERHL